MANQHTQSTQQNTDKHDQSKLTIDESLVKAHKEADKDIENDVDMQPDATDDLDEGELARLEGEN